MTYCMNRMASGALQVLTGVCGKTVPNVQRPRWPSRKLPKFLCLKGHERFRILRKVGPVTGDKGSKITYKWPKINAYLRL